VSEKRHLFSLLLVFAVFSDDDMREAVAGSHLSDANTRFCCVWSLICFPVEKLILRHSGRFYGVFLHGANHPCSRRYADLKCAACFVRRRPPSFR